MSISGLEKSALLSTWSWYCVVPGLTVQSNVGVVSPVVEPLLGETNAGGDGGVVSIVTDQTLLQEP